MDRKKTSFTQGDGVSTAPSRYFGGGASVFNGIGLFAGRDSVTTADSFTEEHHTMTRAELEYMPTEAEHNLLDEVTEQVRERLVFGKGSISWGLRWECGTVDEPDWLLGGWLCQVSRSMLGGGVSSGQSRFCVMDDQAKQFQQCLDERLKVRRSIAYEDMHTVRPRCQESKKESKEDVWYLQVFGKGLKWELMPLGKNGRDVVLRWTAALQYRGGCYDPSIEGEARRAHKAAVWAQSHYRRWKAKQRVQRRRDRKMALMNRLATAIGFNGWDEGSSDDEEDDGYLAQYSNQVIEYGSNVLTNAWTAVGSWLGLGGAISVVLEEEEDEKEQKDTSGATLKRISTAVQFSNELGPLLPGEVEDEVWENQRWTPATGWTAKTLGKTERCPFTDRLGRGSLTKPSGSTGGMDLPEGWEITGDWQIDLSGLNRGRCDKEGYVYSLDWPLLDADLARGKFNVSQGTKDFVRRRRWYRRRISKKQTKLSDTTSPILLTGWLGSRSPGTGRWHSRIFVLTRPGLQIGASVTKSPSITQFRQSFKDYEAVLADGGVDGAKWRALTEKQCTTLELDPRMCRVDESIADPKYPGYFCLLLDGKMKKRMFNAHDGINREIWCNAIRESLAEAAKSKRPKTMRLVGGAFETTCYPTIVMDSLLLTHVDAVEEAICASPSVLAAVHVRSGFKGSETSPWTGNSRKVTYIDENRGGKVTETWVRARTEPGKGFVVDRRIEAPGAQFGEEYAIKCRFVLIAAEMMGEQACRVLVSVDVEFLKQTMMVGFITSGARNALTVSLREIWLPAVVGYLQGKGLLVSEPRKDGEKILWGASSVGASKSKYNKQDSGHIEVGKI